MDDLIKRLKGKYSCGPEGIREDRDFGTYTPAINLEAVKRIEELEKGLKSKNKMVAGLTHNLKVICSELKCVDEKECSKSVWDRVFLALEFAEED